MVWVKRIVLALPFGIAALLTTLVSVAWARHRPSQHIAGLGFLFAAPWAWLIDWMGGGWFAARHARWLEWIITDVMFLWLPALLYAACLWMLFRLASVLCRKDSR